VIAILYCYFSLVFSHFPSTRGLADKLLDFVIQPLTICWQALQKQMPNLFFIFILVMITRYFLKLLHAFFRSIEKGKIKIKNFEQDLAIPTYKLIRVFVIIFAATVAYPFVPGSESPAFKGISIFLGVLVSLGSTSFVSNVIAGLTMTFMRAFKIGDIVKIDDIFGMIVATRLQVTQIKSIKNEIITVPNSKIINSNVMNYSALAQKRGLILHTTVGIGYNAPWRQVRAMLLLAAEKTPGLLRDPAPFVFQLELDNMRVVYEINAYTDQPQKMKEIYSNLHKNILDQFNEYGVEILTPNYETDRATPAIVPKEQWHAAPADRFSEKESEIKKDYSGDAAA
jgi:small-conductance mechanosensitive channel